MSFFGYVRFSEGLPQDGGKEASSTLNGLRCAMWQSPCYWCCACRAGVLGQAIQRCALPGSLVPVGWEAQVERVAQFRSRIDELEAQLARVRILRLFHARCMGKGNWFASVRVL